LSEISEKSRIIEGLNTQSKEMSTEIENLHQRAKQSDQVRQARQKLETENGQLRYEVRYRGDKLSSLN
jgi:FtsZ-binding cell division protein ZapB